MIIKEHSVFKLNRFSPIADLRYDFLRRRREKERFNLSAEPTDSGTNDL